MKKIFIFALTITSILIPISCEDTTLFVDCSKCLVDKPTEVTLKIKISFDNENQRVPVTIYLGDIENGNIIENVTFENSNYRYHYYLVDVGQYYSVLATYKHSGRTIKVVDGKKLRVRLDNSSCDNSCYVIEGDDFDVRLK